MCTGNTSLKPSLKISHSVYPCVYREHNTEHCTFAVTTGLSLCVQGTHRYSLRCCFEFRFIPVCTGNTFLGSNQTLKSPVYPCVYREHGAYVGAHGLNSGLSLCVQGTHIQSIYHYLIPRFIPVCTGNTGPSLPILFKSPVYPCVYREHYY